MHRPTSSSPPSSSSSSPSSEETTAASWNRPSTWIPFLYATLVYYLSLIAAHLPQRYERITGDKSSGEPRRADEATRSSETQDAKRDGGAAPGVPPPSSLADSSLPPPVVASRSFDRNCLTPHLSKEEATRCAFVSTLSLPRSSSRRKPPATSSSSSPSSNLFRPSSFASSTSVSTVSFRSPSPSSSSSSDSDASDATLAASKSKSIIAVVPSGSHVLVGIPKLDHKTESIRIKRTRMSEWLDAEQRDVMRQFDEVIRNEEETSSSPSMSRKKGILKNGSVRSNASSTRSKLETPVFVPPPPPPTAEHHDEKPMEPLPRLAHLEKKSSDQEFGFNLHAERGKGHFIGTVDEGGFGQRAGLEMGQRIVGVNGQLVTQTTKHPDVVALIKKHPMKTTLLVASPEVDKWHMEHHVPYSFDRFESFQETHPHEHHEEAPPLPKSNGYEVAPSLNPHSIQVNEEREVSKLTTTTKTEVISTSNSSYQYKETTTSYDAYAAPPVDTDDLMSAVFAKVELPSVGNQVTVHSHTQELPAEDVSSISSLTSSHRESAVDVPVSHQYVPSYVSQSHQEHSQTQTHHHHHQHQHQQPSPLSNGSSHGYAASSTSGYDDDDIYHLSAKEARERLRMKNRKHHLHEMSLNEKYQLVSNM